MTAPDSTSGSRIGPAGGPASSARAAASEARAPSYREALAIALELASPLPAQRIRLELATDCVLREPIVADRDLPPFDRATMDGYAVRHAEVHVDAAMPVVAKVLAGLSTEMPGGAPSRAVAVGEIPSGSVVIIATGAPVPAGLDTVIEHERSDRGEREVRFSSVPSRGASIHLRGSDARAGETLLAPGVALSPQRIALAAAVGMYTVSVGRRPRLAILTSGDEIVPLDSAPTQHQVRDSNGAMLQSLAPSLGAELAVRRHLGDDAPTAIAALRAAMRDADVVVTVGGISVGERDPFATALAALAADGIAEVRVRKAALQPGGPITIAVLRDADRPATILIGLPGNPLSALVCAHLFLRPIVARLCGADARTIQGEWLRLALVAPAKPNPRRAAFRPAAIVEHDGVSRVLVLPWSGSGDLASARGSDGIVELPMQEQTVPAETVVPFLPWARGLTGGWNGGASASHRSAEESPAAHGATA